MATFPDDTAPSYLLRDRDHVYSHTFRQRVEGMGIREVLTAPHSFIGSVRRDCLNHVVILSQCHLRRILTVYFAYYDRAPNASHARQGRAPREAR